MTILVAFLIAVVAVSLMMTVLVASTRPLRAHDEPIFGATRPGSGATALNRGPHWMDLNGAAPPSAATHAPFPTEELMPPLPRPAPAKSKAPETTASRALTHPVGTPMPRRAASGSRPINPNGWGRVRAEVGTLETIRRQRSNPA